MPVVPEPLENVATYLDNIIALMPGHVYWKDKDGIFLGCNNEQAKFIGLESRHEVVGLTAYDTLPQDFADQVTRVDKEIIATGISKIIEEVLILPNGEESFWLSKKVPLRNEKNEIVGILGISFDITDQRKTEKQLLEAKHKLVEAMELVSTSIAHELRTPLASLNLNISMIENMLTYLFQAYRLARNAHLPVYPIKATHFALLEQRLSSMRKEISASLTFIDMLLLNLTVSADASKMEIFSIRQCVSEALSRYPFISAENERVHWEEDSFEDFKVKGEVLLVTHVLFNLLKNALHYIAKAGKGDIRIWAEQGRPYNTLYFKDTGTGISAEILPHIFERFFSKTTHGAGVGLTFCQSVMENLSGHIACESCEGDYTVFILQFPSLE